MTKSKQQVTGDRSLIERPLPRRQVLRGGLATFAALMMSRTLPGCDSEGPDPMDGGPDGGPPRDAGADAGGSSGAWEPRDFPARPALRSLIADIGALGDPDANGVRLAPGFTSRIIATSGVVVGASGYEWHSAPDGGATYPMNDGGWIYVSNSEVPLIGGVGAVRFDASGGIVDAYPILARTNVNCAGGPTPWGSWLSCEETATGRVHETDPWGERRAVVRPALGVFKHEAVAVDPVNAQLYLSEDESDGRFYRFTPSVVTSHGHPDISSGRLEVAQVAGDGAVTWHELPDPQYEGSLATRRQIPESTAFDGGEGIWWHDGVVYLSTKGDDRIWAFDIEAQTMRTIYDRATSATPILWGVDNLTVSCCGDVLVAEDGGSMQIVAIMPSGELVPLMQVVGHDSSEITGPAFDPSGTRLYFSSQRGSDGNGVTFEITGPFHEPA